MGKLRVLAITLSMSMLMAFAGVAYAEDGRPGDKPGDTDDPGIVALHKAIDDFRADQADLRSECSGALDKAARKECRTASAGLRKAFKDARALAREEHHKFREAQKEQQRELRELRVQKVKPNSPPSATPKPAESPAP